MVDESSLAIYLLDIYMKRAVIGASFYYIAEVSDPLILEYGQKDKKQITCLIHIVQIYY